MAHLSISILGPFQTSVNAQVVAAFQSNKVRALLAFLAAESERPHSRSALAGLLWPDYPDPSALSYLRNALANLRQVIGDAQAQPPYLFISRETIQINPASSLWIDLCAFEDLIRPIEDPRAQIANLQTAIALYRGPFLDGFTCDSSAFEEWAFTWRERFNRLFRETLSSLASLYGQTGDHTASIQTARRLLELEPWDEAAHRLVMEGLARSGQRSAALTQYEACQRILEQELGVQPSAETESLVESIRSGELGPVSEKITLSTKPALLIQPRLPTPITTFIGRQSELSEIRHLLCPPTFSDQLSEGVPRLFTLIGPGGCGKTRLAIEVCHSLIDNGCFPHGVWWVDLTFITDPALVNHTVAAAYGLEESGRTPILQLLINFLREKELFLALDNCEHLIEPTAQLVQTLLDECPGMQILATSREPLSIPGEIPWQVPSMSFPEFVDKEDYIRLFDSVRLFEERARAVKPDWKLEGNTSGVVEICCRLDGIPLAIELAAARLRMMTVEQIASRLDDTFHLLTGGHRTALERHQTLRACIDWSYNLLSPAERALLRQLSVFQGGWTLEAVEFIGEKDPIPGVQPDEILDVLSRLVDRSLVVVQSKGQGMRYRLLDTIRQYAHEKLIEAGEEEAACRRHLAYYLDLAVRAEGQLRGPDQVKWQELVKTELDNLRAALSWALATDHLAELRIASALFWFWRFQFRWQYEGLQWLEQGLIADAAEPQQATDVAASRAWIRGWALNVASWFVENSLQHAFAQIYPSVARRQEAEHRLVRYSDEALAIFRGLGRSGRLGLGFSLFLRPEKVPELKKAQMEESLAIFREDGEKFYMSECLYWLGHLALDARDYSQAKIYYEQHLALRLEIGDLEGLGFAHYILGNLEYLISHFDTAKKYLYEALRLYQMIGFSKEFTWRTTEILANIAVAQSDFTEAINYSEKLLAIARETGEDWQYAFGLFSKGSAMLQGDLDMARTLLNESMALFRKLGNGRGMVFSIERQAHLAKLLKRPERAARLLSASLHHREAERIISHQNDQTWYENLRKDIQTALGEQAFTKAWAEGEAMNLEQAVAYALDEFEPY